MSPRPRAWRCWTTIGGWRPSSRWTPAAAWRCRDGDDQKFLELAPAGAADLLVTADKALLVLARRHRLAHLFGIVTPDAALAELSLTLRG